VSPADLPRSDAFIASFAALSTEQRMAAIGWVRHLARVDERPGALAAYVGERVGEAARYEIHPGLWIEARITFDADGRLEHGELLDIGVAS
jgi:hypothetical protein